MNLKVPVCFFFQRSKWQLVEWTYSSDFGKSDFHREIVILYLDISFIIYCVEVQMEN